jgi:hypothetical protein
MMRALPLAVLLVCCGGRPGAPAPAPISNQGKPVPTPLAQKLITDAYGPVFVWPQHDATIDRVWSEPGNAGDLEALLDDRQAPIKARLLAAEALFKHDFSFLDRHDNAEVARIYAEALAHHTVPAANVWGLLWINDRVGELGGRFVMLGADAVPALRALLDDRSEQATLGNGARYRICDFAAYYLARITGQSLAFHPDFAARDHEIAKLK